MGKFRTLLCVCVHVFLRADIINHGLQFQLQISTQTSEMIRFLVLYIVCLGP